MSINFSLLFYLKKQKNHRKGPVPIYLRLTVSGKRAELATGRAIEPERWIAAAGRAAGTKAASKSLNAYLDKLQAKVYEAHRQLVEANHLPTAEAIKHKFLGKEEKGRSLVEVYREHNKKVAALVGEEFAPGTLERYTTSLKHTREFMKWKYGVDDIDIKKKEFASERLAQVRDIFLFSCFTGLAYVDVQQLQYSDIQKGVDGEQWIYKNRQKTDTSSRIPLLPTVLNLIEKYKRHPPCIPALLPFSNCHNHSRLT